MEDLLECPVEMEQFSSNASSPLAPIALDCGHTFSRRAVQGVCTLYSPVCNENFAEFERECDAQRVTDMVLMLAPTLKQTAMQMLCVSPARCPSCRAPLRQTPNAKLRPNFGLMSVIEKLHEGYLAPTFSVDREAIHFQQSPAKALGSNRRSASNVYRGEHPAS